MKLRITIAIVLLFIGGIAQANKNKIKVNVGTDIVSSYIWRGTYNAGASFQPSLSAELVSVRLSAWGSTDFVGKCHKEIDLALAYSIKGFTIGITDYWWEGEGVMNYFDYNMNGAHRFEGNISYQLPISKFPLIVSWNTMFIGNDHKEDGKRAYSTYIELNYPFSTFGIDMNVIVGATPWYSPSILPSDNTGFSVCNVAVNGSKTLKLSDNFSMPIYTRLIFNPAIEDAYFIVGLSLLFSN